MCLAVYLSTDIDLSVLDWNDKKIIPYFSVLKETDASVKKLFSLKNIYYVSSSEGCGCGFLLDGKEGDELREAHESYVTLADFLQTQIKQGEVEIFSCWDGDHEKPITHNEKIDLNTLRKPDFCFQNNFNDRRFYKVSIRSSN